MSKATLKPVISKLREIIIKDISGKMEKYGFDDAGRLINNKPLSEYDSVIKNNLVSLFKGKNIEGNKKEYIGYIQDSARTFLHILICFKTMEQRGIMGNVIGRLMNDHIYDAVIPDFINVPPMAFSDLSEKFRSEISVMEEKDNCEEDRDYYNFIYMLSALTKEMAKEVPLLFKDYEHNLIHPDFEGLKEILFNINKIDENEYDEDDFLGWIYQYWVDIKADELKAAKEEKDVSYANSIFYEILNNLEDEQTQFGEFYTPRWVVKYIVNNTLKPYFEENKKIENIKLLDPACGAGNFLVYAFDVFFELYKIEHPDWPDNHVISSILEKNIFGVDIQREPLQITAINLWLKAKKKAQDAKIKSLNLFNMNILKANSLYRWENDQEEVVQLSLFQTDIELTEKQYTAEDIGQYISTQVFKAKIEARLFFKNKFNVVVMNPPYLGIRKMNKDVSDFLKREYPKYYNNLFEAFVARAMELLSKNGIMGFVGSDTFMTLESHKNIRHKLLDETVIKEIIKLGNNVFDGPTVNAALLIAQKNKKNSEASTKCATLSSGNLDITSVEFKNIIQSNFKIIKGYPFIFGFTERLVSIFRENKKLSNYVLIKQGIMTGDNAKFIKNKWEIPAKLRGQDYVPFAKGGGFSKYANDMYDYLLWANDGELIKKEAKEKYGSETRTIKNQDLFFKGGVTYSHITSNNRFSARKYPDGCIFGNAGPCIFSDDISNDYLLGFVNSKYLNYVVLLLNPTANFEIGDLERVPYIKPDIDSENEVVSKTIRARTIKEHLLGFDYKSDFYHNVELKCGFTQGAKNVKEAFDIFAETYIKLERELYELQREIDLIIYRVYNLSVDDIRVIEEALPDSEISVSKSIDMKKCTLNYLRSIVKDTIINMQPKLFTDEEIVVILAKYIEESHENGYEIVNEIEAILGKSLIEVVRGGVKIGSSNLTLAGKGIKDNDEPLLQQLVLSGTGSSKKVVIWHLSHFLIDFEDDKKYVMQNEIRRLSNELYRPRLQTIKEKLQGSISVAEKKELEKQEKLLSEAVKTLEAWKVVN